MTLVIYGKPVVRIVVHGSEETLWEPPASGSGAMLKISEPLEMMSITDQVNCRADSVHCIKPERLRMTENILNMFDPVHSPEQAAGITDSVKAFINDEKIL